MSRTALRHIAISRDPAPGSRGWRVVRTEGADPAQSLEGRPVEEAASLAPRIFNLCGAAHGLAAARALGLPVAANDRAIARESVRDHALAILHGWPTLLDGAPDRTALRALAQDSAEADAALRAALVGERLAHRDFGALARSELGAWLCAGETATARILSRLSRELDPAEGRVGLPELTAVDLSRALAVELEHDGSARPLPFRETGALGRVAGSALFTALLPAEGPSLFVRLLARLTDLLALLTAPAAPPAPSGAPGTGLADAARGLLGHGARVEDGRVARYRILSPSAWNLAPGGLLEQAFATLDPSAPHAPLAARFLLSAINPCVPVTLDLEGALDHA